MIQIADDYRFEEVKGGVCQTEYLGKDENVTVPAEIDGKRVVALRGTFCEKMVKTVTIPASVERIVAGTFECHRPQPPLWGDVLEFDEPWEPPMTLERLEVAPDSRYFKAVDGVLYSADMSELICCPAGKEGRFGIPAGVVRIADGAFFWCKTLSSVTIPEGVTEIGERAFCRCYALSSITLPESLTHIGKRAFEQCTSLERVEFSSGVASIGEYAFAGCDSLESIALSEGVTEIGGFAFLNCKSLRRAALPATLEKCSGSIFSNCDSLREVTINSRNPYYKIENGAMYTADGRELVCILTRETEQYSVPEGVERIAKCAFDECKYLRKVTLPDSVTEIGEDAFGFCKVLREITIPANLCHVRDFAFMGCASLEQAMLSAKMTCIGIFVFDGCKSIREVTIPDSVTEIGEEAFANCTSLESVTLPDSIESIADDAFAYCPNLTVRCSAESYARQWCEENDVECSMI